MKKRLEADLMSIAHRVLQIKNKSDINQLYIESQKLYEKLSILRFVEEHFGGAKPTIGQAEIVEKMKEFFENNTVLEFRANKANNEIVAEEIVADVVVTDEKIETSSEQIDEIALEEIIEDESIELDNIEFQPTFELDDEEEKEVPNKPEEVQISFLDLLGADYREPLFVKVDQSEETPTTIAFDIPEEADFSEEELFGDIEENPEKIEPKKVSLNEKLSKGINIDLNDRIAFVKHLFGNSDEDYNRVLNQLITYDNFEDAQNFIEDLVKPDYNSWEGKEDYAQRFIEIVEKKFS
ncbi:MULTISPECIES: hypothetical protein [unclassified Flavobacterium]|jgi:hypothetical protein|uniref:hypothetical protein n=1 Tax=unclassified Flavobacterium TaxID=196869 RepID=UPI0025BD91B0|nr:MULTISPECIES: hypothetical protein [unclassified Flavobacterium]